MRGGGRSFARRNKINSMVRFVIRTPKNLSRRESHHENAAQT